MNCGLCGEPLNDQEGPGHDCKGLQLPEPSQLDRIVLDIERLEKKIYKLATLFHGIRHYTPEEVRALLDDG